MLYIWRYVICRRPNIYHISLHSPDLRVPLGAGGWVQSAESGTGGDKYSVCRVAVTAHLGAGGDNIWRGLHWCSVVTDHFHTQEMLHLIFGFGHLAMQFGLSVSTEVLLLGRLGNIPPCRNVT